jgi:hypothetical protein
MNSNEKTTQTNLPSRRKFVWGVGILSAFAAVGAATGLPFFGKKNAISLKAEGKNSTVKMLTEDGRLVEIDEVLITSGKKKISNTELQQWVKK